MLVQDQMTGYVSEVPDHLYGYDGYEGYGEYPELGESQMLYDGLGNPVGMFPAIAALAAKALPMISQAIPGISNIASKIPILGNLFGGGNAPGAPAPGLPGLPPLPIPLPFPIPRPPMPFRPPWPQGWMNAPLPYTGLGPRRLYMRCAVWPGPKGLVPAHVANMPAGALPAVATSPAAAAAQAAAQAATAAAMGGRRRRRRRR